MLLGSSFINYPAFIGKDFDNGYVCFQRNDQ